MWVYLVFSKLLDVICQIVMLYVVVNGQILSKSCSHLVTWLSKRLGSPLKAPDFSAQGFELLGGRLLSGGGGPVAQFMYQSADQRRVTLYVRREAGSKGRDNTDTSFRHAHENGIEVFYWIDQDMGYALSGGIARAEMQLLADAAYRQIGR